MHRRLAAILVLGALAASGGGAAGAGECFCLYHEATGAILRGCEAYKAPTDGFRTADCTDPDTGEKSEQIIYSDWQRIEAGANRCDPCRRVARGAAPEVPRNRGEGTPP